MVQFLLFVVGCLVVQEVKNRFRKPRTPVVSMAPPPVPVRAKCGYLTETADRVTYRMVKPCEAHKALMEA